MENYIYYNLSEKSDNFDDNFEENKLYLFTGNINYYGYDGFQKGMDDNPSVYDEFIDTYFARYLSFVEVEE
jgi:hypothetical protein